MKKILFACIIASVLGPACMVKTVFYNVNPKYESHTFVKETVAVSPLSGLWKTEGPDTVFKRAVEYYSYAEAIARQIIKKRPCLEVIDPETVAKKIPDIESLTFKYRNLYKSTGTDDSTIFSRFQEALNADYLVFIESIFFNNDESVTPDTIASMSTTILVFQVWDLKNRQFMYRGETKGSGDATWSGRAGKDSRSGNTRIQNIAYELVRSLPPCK
jgi:hypothetical protein